MPSQHTTSAPYEYIFLAEQIRLHIIGGYEPFFYPNDFDVPDDIFHTHEWFEMFFVEDGAMECYLEHMTLTVHAGEFIIIRPGVSHYTGNSKEHTSVSVFNFSYEILDPHTKAPWISLFDFTQYLHFHGDTSCLSLGRLFGDALKTGHGSAAGSYLFSLLTRISCLEHPEQNRTDTLLTDSNLGRIYRLNQILQGYYKTDISLSAIASELHISERQLSRIIQKQFGCSYREKITALRMEEAKKLLSSGTGVTKTALAVGYSSVGAFHNAFVKHYGVSPGTFHRP